MSLTRPRGAAPPVGTPREGVVEARHHLDVTRSGGSVRDLAVIIPSPRRDRAIDTQRKRVIPPRRYLDESTSRGGVRDLAIAVVSPRLYDVMSSKRSRQQADEHKAERAEAS